MTLMLVIAQLVGTDLVPEDDEGVQRLLLGALLLPQLLGLSAADTTAARRLADSAKVRHCLLLLNCMSIDAPRALHWTARCCQHVV